MKKLHIFKVYRVLHKKTGKKVYERKHMKKSMLVHE